MADHHRDDHRTTLVNARLVHVEQCACGVVHLTLGAITMRLQREAFSEMADAVALAAAALDERARRAIDPQLLI